MAFNENNYVCPLCQRRNTRGGYCLKCDPHFDKERPNGGTKKEGGKSKKGSGA